MIDILLAKWYAKVAEKKNLNIAFEEMDKTDQDKLITHCEEIKTIDL